MTSANLGKILEYLKIQENLLSKNLTKYYLCKGMLLYVFLYPERYKHNVKQIIELAKILWLFSMLMSMPA